MPVLVVPSASTSCVTDACIFETMNARGSRKSSKTTSSVATPLLITQTTSRGVIGRIAGLKFSIC